MCRSEGEHILHFEKFLFNERLKDFYTYNTNIYFSLTP